jgi:hypothetical protein
VGPNEVLHAQKNENFIDEKDESGKAVLDNDHQ